jgi:cysteinyl-tRNA synthetase
MLMTHYREPIDFSVRRLEEAENLWKRWARFSDQDGAQESPPDDGLVHLLLDDLDFASFFKGVASLTVVANGVLGGGGGPLTADNAETAANLARGRLVSTLRLLGFRFESSAGVGDERAVQEIVDRRLAFIASKNWAEADRIRDELLAQRIQLKDGKDPATGERTTTWEVKR